MKIYGLIIYPSLPFYRQMEINFNILNPGLTITLRNFLHEHNMHMSFMKSVIISLLFLLSSCSVLRLSYDQGPHLVWWWLDGYVNFSSEQTPHAKQAIRQWFDWHRTTQLEEYADRLAMLRGQLDDTITPVQVCRWSEEIREIITPALDHALQLGTQLVPGLGEAQWRHIEERYAKSNDEFRRDYLQPNAVERLKASVKRTVKRTENLYGNLDEIQRNLILTNLQASPYDPEAWLAERQRRQRETLQTLRQMGTEPVETEEITAALRKLIGHIEHSADPDYRNYQMKLTEYNCAFIARMHNSTNPLQRQHARDKLKHWETDLRLLSARTP
jgi:hypothetical protein